MSLDKDDLQDDLEASFGAPGATAAACAAQWADAVGGYAGDVVPASTAVAVAQAALQAALALAFVGTDKATTATKMEAAFAAFGTAVGGGMAGFTPTPPASAVGFATLFAADPLPETNEDAADAFATAIHTWLKTGTATPLPSGAVVHWK